MRQPRKHANIPIFIPHLGCPNACVFCDQRAISGHHGYDPDHVRREIEEILTTLDDCEHREIAFFGGSFTGIDRAQMIALLELAQSYVNRGAVESIRLSTRPDYIDQEILSILSRYAVRTVELGLQSMDDRVLAASRRGHDSQIAQRACALIKASGFELVGQMMIGLPLSDGASEKMTADRIVSLGADAARVYPTVVFRGTGLARMTEQGGYHPLTEEEAVSRTADVLEIFDRGGIPVILGDAFLGRVGVGRGQRKCRGRAGYGRDLLSPYERELEKRPTRPRGTLPRPEGRGVTRRRPPTEQYRATMRRIWPGANPHL